MSILSYNFALKSIRWWYLVYKLYSWAEYGYNFRS